MSENKTERRLAHSGDTPDLRGVIGDENPEDVDVFAFQIVSTTGDFTVPREDLLDKIDDVGLPKWMAPNPVAPHRAWGRMADDLEDEFEDEKTVDGHRVRIKMDSGSSHYEQHLHAMVWHSPGDESTTAGKWVDHELGVLRYTEKDISWVDRVDDSHPFSALWTGVKSLAQKRFEAHQSLHNGDDIGNMVYYLQRQWTDSVKLRDAAYLVPATYDGIESYIDGFRELYEWIDRNYKTSGQDTELFAIEIVDTERQREMVESRVRTELREDIEDTFDSLVDDLAGGEETAEDVAEQVVEDMDSIEGTADTHRAVLKTELSVKRAMQDVLEDMSDEREELVEQVLDEAGIAPEGGLDE